ncbi:kinesin family member heavy chain [Raphidocelis subcapitata]|uniref:Kinesin family member heavy chain n=1 Tax=Raphidocelis subcapitata TaxID=307507 RepID=A0A2V0NVL4_9CHLO|nr:kinesin family member heavy chain [Raphidocelis subcapitata]|eukprot:GBF91684.1 kinesin family member heavy chain [Raphidocelis subcapitata]
MAAPAASRPSTAGASKKSEESVCVAVNIRPLIDIELDQGCQECLFVTPGLSQVTSGTQAYTYDHIFGGDCGDALCNLYPKCVAPLLDGLFRGYNATVFAYGQTGSGKTYTMGSGFSPGGPARGVIPEVMEELFARIEAGKEGSEFSVRVSFVEIHKEEVRDLLFVEGRGPRPQVTIRELPSGVTLSGAVEREVHSREEMVAVLEQGSLCRAVGATNMNNRSSRSHAIFTITLEQRRMQPSTAAASRAASPARRAAAAAAGDAAAAAALVAEAAEDEEEEDDDGEDGDGGDDSAEDYLIAKMHLVDLAGSERAKRTGAEGARLREAININKGLLALAKVISALVDNQGHVPYRDSKLTRLLQDSLGGNSRTLMLACVSPADVNREESLNTLRYADRARHIKNKPVVNRDPVAAQLANLRQQLAALRAENVALKRTIGAAGGDPDALAALVSGSALPPGEALQEAYDELAMRCNVLEAQHARDAGELADLRGETADLRERLLAAETARDSARLRLQALRATAGAGDARPSSRASDAPAAEAGDGAEAAPGARGAAPEAGAVDEELVEADVDVIAELRARICELEGELRQARSLQRAQSSMLRSGANDGVAAAAAAAVTGRRGVRGGGLRSTSGGGAGAGSLPGSRFTSAGGFLGAPGALVPDEDDGDASTPLTPAQRPAEAISVPLEEADSSKDAELIAGTTAHFVSQEQLKNRLADIARQMAAKQRRLAALQSAVGVGDGLKAQYDGHLQALQAERDALLKEKSGLLQKLHKAAEASAEERRRLEALYREKLAAVERRVKELGDREREARRGSKQLARVEQVCRQLQDDIVKMKGHKAAVLRRMEQREREFREWRAARERELAQLRRSAQRQNAALQQHQAMHLKQQAVLKRKTEEAEAAKKRLRELIEVQARARNQRADAAAARGGGELEMQPNAGAPLLRSERARREWVEQELDLCNTSWEYMKVLEGELAQRAEKTHRLREVQKQLMLLGGMVPPSPVVFSNARGASVAGAPATPVGGGGSQEALLGRKQRLEDDIERHNEAIKELQLQWERARQDEEGRGGGAADVKRWTGIRTVVEGRELLRTLFRVALDNKASLNEAHMELAKICEEMDILRIMLDTAQQQAGEARRKAVETEATALAVISSTPLAAMDRVGLSGGGAGAGAGAGVDRTLRDADELIRELGIKLARLSAAAEDGGGGGGGGAAGEEDGEGGAAGKAAAGGGKDISKLFSMLGHLENDWEVFVHRDGAGRRSGGRPAASGTVAPNTSASAPGGDTLREPLLLAPPLQQQQPSQEQQQQRPEQEPDGPEETDKAEIAEIVRSLDFDSAAAAAAAAASAAAAAASGARASLASAAEEFHDAEEGEEDDGWDDDGGSSGTGGEDDSGSGVGESEEVVDDEDDEDYVPTPAAPRRLRGRAVASAAAGPGHGAEGGGRGGSGGGGGGGGAAVGGSRRRGGRRRGGGAGSGAEGSDAASPNGPSRLGSPPGSPGAAGRAGSASPANRRQPAAGRGFKRAESQRRRVLFHAWATPVLQHINEARAKQGKPAVQKLTVKVLKDGLEGAVINGAPFRPGAMTRDQLIDEYRRHLLLPTDLAEGIATAIDRVTGVAQWLTLNPASTAEEEDLLAAVTAAAGAAAGGGAPGGAGAAAGGSGGGQQQHVWVPAAAPQRARPGSGGGAGGPVARVGGEACGSPLGSPVRARVRRMPGTPPEAGGNAILAVARRPQLHACGDSAPASPRDPADSPQRARIAAAAAAAQRVRNAGRLAGPRPPGSGDGLSAGPLSASYDSGLGQAFKRAIREAAADRSPVSSGRSAGGAAPPGRLQLPLALPAAAPDGGGAGRGAEDGGGCISARGPGKNIWR